MIKSKSYQLNEGLNYIESSDLVMTKLYAVKRSGLQYDANVSGASNRIYIYSKPMGRIYFESNGNPGGEKVFVIFKQTSADSGEIPGICNPVFVPAEPLENGFVGRLYKDALLVFGTSPISFSVIDKPAWSEVIFLLYKLINISGIPDAVGTYTFQFSLNNCGGPYTITRTINVYDAASNLNVSTTGSPQRINSITGISYTIISGSFPVRQGTFPPTMEAVFEDYTGVINVAVSGIFFPKTLILYKNGIVQQSIPVPSTGTYTFSSASYLSTDNLQITL